MQVLGVDIREEVVKIINQGEIHIHEPDLDILVRSAVHSGQLTAALKPDVADVFVLAVPTPFKENHVPDLSYVESATRAIAPLLKRGDLVILESTSPVGTTDQISDWISEMRPDLRRGEICLAHCPERVLPGRILKELVDNDRVVGGIDGVSTERAFAFYQQFVSGQIFKTDARTAEMVKLTENSYRDVNIAFANELSLVCERLKTDVWEVIELANRHPRVKILQPGPGVGGHCIAVDPWFIIHSAPEQARLMRSAREVNDSKPHFVVEKIREKAERFKAPKIAMLGLAFKANVDDLRESPAMEIVEEVAKGEFGEILVVEPHIRELPGRLKKLARVTLCDLGAALLQSDILVLLVNHREFAEVDRALLAEKVVIDTCGMWRVGKR